MRTEKTIYIATFGCRTNQADSAAIRESFQNEEFREVLEASEADVIVVNSCTVTHRSDQQVRQLARKLRRANPGAKLLVTGCYAQRDPEELAEIEGIDAVVGNTLKQDLVQIASNVSDVTGCDRPTRVCRDSFEKVRAIDLTPATSVGGRTRPYVKVQDGCDARCSYCIIPSVRGSSRSVHPDRILRQVAELIERGFREIVLTGIHIGSYGQHLKPRQPLDRLIERIVGLPGLGQIRISSIEPMELSRRIIDLAAGTERIAPHFHICLQSGSNQVLRAMLRPYKTERFAQIVDEIRQKIPEAGIGTDVIVGFPGESESDHQETMEFLESGPYTYVHVFPYSDRSGTAASEFSVKVPSHTIRRRAEEIRSLSVQKNTEFRTGFLGRRLKFLTLTDSNRGLREAVSGNYLKVKTSSDCPGNRLAEGTITSAESGHLLAEDVNVIA